MLTNYFESPHTLKCLRSGLAGPFIEGFAQHLSQAGYSRCTIRAYLSTVAHLGHWAKRKGLTIEQLDGATRQAFQRHLRSCRCLRRNQGKFAGIASPIHLFLTYLRQIGALVRPRLELRGPKAVPLLVDFRRWMVQHRGVTESTLDLYAWVVTRLLKTLGHDPSHYDAHSLRAFVLEDTKRYARSSARIITPALRMFLRYLIVEGKCSADLDAAIPTVAGWRLSSLPRYLPPGDVERVVAACDPSTPVGCRDRAVILLLARLGLRGGDVVRLRITDIDWQEASIRLSGKERCEVRLPLTQEVGDAILKYLEQGRPRLQVSRLFIRARAPLAPFSDSSAVSTIVRRALRRAGVVSPFRGAHVLRHSAATEMLRQGVSLQNIGAVLRHRSLETTAHYAKVDVALLRLVAQPWPEVTSC